MSFIFIIVLVSATFFVEYAETVTVDVNIKYATPPATFTANSEISFYTKLQNGDAVRKDSVIGFISSPSTIATMTKIKAMLNISEILYLKQQYIQASLYRDSILSMLQIFDEDSLDVDIFEGEYDHYLIKADSFNRLTYKLRGSIERWLKQCTVKSNKSGKIFFDHRINTSLRIPAGAPIFSVISDEETYVVNFILSEPVLQRLSLPSEIYIRNPSTSVHYNTGVRGEITARPTLVANRDSIPIQVFIRAERAFINTPYIFLDETQAKGLLTLNKTTLLRKMITQIDLKAN